MPDREPNVVTSSLSRTIAVDGVTVEANIYRLEHNPQWALEAINAEGTSTVWDALFDTDEEAFAAFQLTVEEEEGIESFLDRGNVIPFPRRR